MFNDTATELFCLSCQKRQVSRPYCPHSGTRHLRAVAGRKVGLFVVLSSFAALWLDRSPPFQGFRRRVLVLAARSRGQKTPVASVALVAVRHEGK